MIQYVIKDSTKEIYEIETETPSVDGFDILVEIKAGSINPVDLKVKSMFSGDQPKTLGYDAAGIVRAIGESVTDFVIGDEVYYAGDISRDGSNATEQVVDSRIVAKRPQSITFEESAAIPLTAITACEALFSRMRIPKNQPSLVLIIGGAGGVGSMAIQLLKAITDCHIIATASKRRSTKWCKELGADTVVDHSQPIKPQLDALEIGEVDYIFCANDTTFHWNNMVESIAPQGTICSIVDNSEPVALNDLKKKSVTFAWEFMFTRPLFKTKDIRRQHDLLTEVRNLIDGGEIRSTQTESVGELSVESLNEGHEMIASGHSVGKITWRIE